MKGTPLDDLLKAPSAQSLTEDELEQQLFGTARPSPSPSPSDSTPSGGASALSQLFAQAQIAEEQSHVVDAAIKTASNGVKVLAPLLAAISNWVDPESQSGEIERIMAATLQKVGHDTATVISAFGLTPDKAPMWLTSQISGQIMQILVSAIERNNGMTLDASSTSYLEPMLSLANQAKGIGTHPYGSTPDASWQLVNALTLASAEVMTEYHVFNYFHPDPQRVSQWVTDLLNERVIEGTLDTITTRFSLNDGERAYLGVSLLRQAGKLMADAWTRNIATTIESVKEMPTSTRREVIVEGYPLDTVVDDFDAMYQGLEVSALSAIRSLSPHRERQQQRVSHGQGMR